MGGVLRSKPATALCLPLPILWQLLQAARVQGGVMGGEGGRPLFHALWGVPGQL